MKRNAFTSYIWSDFSTFQQPRAVSQRLGFGCQGAAFGAAPSVMAMSASRDEEVPFRILVVDDEPEVRRLICEILLREGFRVDQAEDGEAGWVALHSGIYDLVITDHNMPKLSGVELIKKIRNAQMEIPAILLSGAIPTQLLQRNPALELSAVLAKPFHPGELVTEVNSLLNGNPGLMESWQSKSV